MKKQFLSELILPSFWLLFFILSPKTENRVNQLKKEENTEFKKPDSPGASNSINKNKEAIFTKAIYLTGF